MYWTPRVHMAVWNRPVVTKAWVGTQRSPGKPEGEAKTQQQPPVTHKQAEAKKVILVRSQWAEVDWACTGQIPVCRGLSWGCSGQLPIGNSIDSGCKRHLPVDKATDWDCTGQCNIMLAFHTILLYSSSLQRFSEKNLYLISLTPAIDGSYFVHPIAQCI